jgi:phage terminase small subunit
MTEDGSRPLKNAAHEAFCQEYAKTSNAAGAWRKATGKTANADVNGTNWLVKAGFDLRIDKIRQDAAKTGIIERDEGLEILAEIARQEGNEPRDRISALKVAGTWCGWEKGTEAENKIADALSEELERIRAKK